MNYDSKINNYNASEVNEIGVNTMKVEIIQTGVICKIKCRCKFVKAEVNCSESKPAVNCSEMF